MLGLLVVGCLNKWFKLLQAKNLPSLTPRHLIFRQNREFNDLLLHPPPPSKIGHLGFHGSGIRGFVDFFNIVLLIENQPLIFQHFWWKIQATFLVYFFNNVWNRCNQQARCSARNTRSPCIYGDFMGQKLFKDTQKKSRKTAIQGCPLEFRKVNGFHETGNNPNCVSDKKGEGVCVGGYHHLPCIL